MTDAASAQPIRLSDYQPPDYLVDRVDLRIELDPAVTRVTCRLDVVNNHDRSQGSHPLVLDGHDLVLRAVRVDGRRLGESEYRQVEGQLIVHDLPACCTVETEVEIAPETNTELEGLYRSNGIYCTQCEPEGFRRITYFPDRPDVMARFATTLVGDKRDLPVLLANGNLVARGEERDRHWVRWEDPYPKPSYLFALVAGDLAVLKDEHTTPSGRTVQLRLYTEPRNAGKAGYAMASLKRAMAWDETRYGRECDLNTYMIVAVDDFNMGAMENKGLNIFNSQFILANPQSATDDDFLNIESVVAHEYFHNWTGNRITCRDWFQLTLKEGLTVFRDQQFSAEMNAPAVERIEEVRRLRTTQFPEDAGPMAHPIQPTEYYAINNFYTATVYEKGAEVIRMLHTLLGEAAFRRGMDEYFERYDRRPITTEHFLRAFEIADGRDLSQFRRWYRQAGTPEIEVTWDYDPATRTGRLTLRQACPPTPGQSDKEPFHIPVAIGLIGADGDDLPVRLASDVARDVTPPTTRILELTEAVQTFECVDLPAQAPVLSLLRGFSAPVRLRMDEPYEAVATRLVHDSDPFNRWEASQQLALRTLLPGIEALRAGTEMAIDQGLIDSLGGALTDRDSDPALLAEALTLPSEEDLAEHSDPVDPLAIREAREQVRRTFVAHYREELLQVYHENQVVGPYELTPAAIGRRRLKNLCLAYLSSWPEDAEVRELAWQQFKTAENMTDRLTGLRLLVDVDCDEREAALNAFYQQWRDEPNVLDKWFATQAASTLPDALESIVALLEHAQFDSSNPNRVRAVLGTLARRNPVHFHRADGAGYELVAEQIRRLDGLNPQIAARLATAFSRWERMEPTRRAHMRGVLEGLVSQPVSRQLQEVIDRQLGSAREA